MNLNFDVAQDRLEMLQAEAQRNRDVREARAEQPLRYHLVSLVTLLRQPE